MDSRPPVDFAAFIATISRELTSRRIPFMLIGGQAVLLHGQPRLTEDIDITLGIDPSRLAVVVEVCESLDLQPLPPDPDAFVRDTYVLPAGHRATGLRVDFIFSTTPYERQAIERAIRVTLGGAEVPFATAEDLIIHKLFAGRARDEEDAAGVARRQSNRLDWDYIERWVREFAVLPGREDLPQRAARLKAQA